MRVCVGGRARFYRKLLPTARPIAFATNDAIITAPGDVRLIVFPSITADSPIWIKEQPLTVAQLLGGGVSPAVAAALAGGALVIARLAPQDYHRFHASTPGTLLSTTPLAGSLYSVNADGIRSNNGGAGLVCGCVLWWCISVYVCVCVRVWSFVLVGYRISPPCGSLSAFRAWACSTVLSFDTVIPSRIHRIPSELRS